MELGCSTLLYGALPLERALDGIARTGYRAIELCAIQGMANHLPDDLRQDGYRDIVLMAHDRGLAIESVGVSTNLLDGQAAFRLMRLLKAAALIGAPYITTGAGGKPDDEDSFKKVVATLNELAKTAAHIGTKISLKPHVNTAMYSTRTALRLMNEVDTRWIGLNVDASHLWRTPEHEMPEETIPQLLPYLFTARIRDTKGREIPIGPVDTQIPGGGALNLPAIVSTFKQKPDLKYLTLEIVGTHASTEADHVDSIAKTCFEKLTPLVNQG
jgi:sugar phosphate isomerase/epimerase